MPSWMTGQAIWLWIIYGTILLATAKPLGTYMYKVFTGQRTFMYRAVRPLEVGIYRLTRVDENEEMGWIAYVVSSFAFCLVSLFALYLILRTQGIQPGLFNPERFPDVGQFLAWNTAVSFSTNTNWQNYGGESTLTYLTQMMGLTFHNFGSAAVGIAWAVALVRGLARRSAGGVGSFWVDMVRASLYVLVPISFIYALFLIWQGVPDNLAAYTVVHTLEGAKQIIAQGPVAGQEAIKMVGTNGGGFMNANSAHPFENPTPLSDFIEILSILFIGSGLVYLFGKWVKDTKQGWALWATCFVLFSIGYFTAVSFEQAGNPIIASKAHVAVVASSSQPGGNMEGKEQRFGIPESALFATATTDASDGAINSWHDSYTPLGGLVPLTNMATGEVIFGGVGAGLYGLLMYAIIAVFIAGLMVGRTPEYLGKKIESFEVKMASIALLISPANILILAAIAMLGTWGLSSIDNPGPHGLTEILYLFTSSNANNGSAFAGLTSNTNFFNVSGGIAMLIGRFLFVTPLLAIAGSMARKKPVAPNLGTFPTNGPTFTVLMIAVIVIVAALTYFPVYSLGPIIEQLLMHAGKTF